MLLITFLKYTSQYRLTFVLLLEMWKTNEQRENFNNTKATSGGDPDIPHLDSAINYFYVYLYSFQGSVASSFSQMLILAQQTGFKLDSITIENCNHIWMPPSTHLRSKCMPSNPHPEPWRGQSSQFCRNLNFLGLCFSKKLRAFTDQNNKVK